MVLLRSLSASLVLVEVPLDPFIDSRVPLLSAGPQSFSSSTLSALFLAAVAVVVTGGVCLLAREKIEGGSFTLI